MVVGLAVVVAPAAAIIAFGALPLVVLGPAERVVGIVLAAGQPVGLHIARVVGCLVPESPHLGRVGALPRAVHLLYKRAYLRSLLHLRSRFGGCGKHTYTRC